MRDSLTLLGDEYKVLEASDGRSGLDLIRASQPDMVLLDISMPELGGVPVCTEIKGDPATADIEIVIVSARTEADFIDATLDAGASDYVTKPFLPRDLVRRVRGLLDKVGASA